MSRRFEISSPFYQSITKVTAIRYSLWRKMVRYSIGDLVPSVEKAWVGVRLPVTFNFLAFQHRHFGIPQKPNLPTDWMPFRLVLCVNAPRIRGPFHFSVQSEVFGHSVESTSQRRFCAERSQNQNLLQDKYSQRTFADFCQTMETGCSEFGS